MCHLFLLGLLHTNDTFNKSGRFLIVNCVHSFSDFNHVVASAHLLTSVHVALRHNDKYQVLKAHENMAKFICLSKSFHTPEAHCVF